MDDTQHIGLVIKALREERGLSKKRLAREALISDAYLVQIEQGQRTPSEKIARRIAAAMQLPPSRLLVPMGVYPAQVREGAADWIEYVNDRRKEVGEGPMSPLTQERVYSEALDVWPDEGTPSMSELPFPLLGDELERGYQNHPEGWDELSEKDQRLMQQMINRLRFVDSEG